jgi:hypothetical protein
MDIAALIESYLAGPENLRHAIAGMTSAQLVARPVAGKWSSLEVVCHLADTDANIAHRIKRVLSEDGPTFERVNPAGMVAALAYHERDAAEEIALIELTRRQIVRIVRAMPPESWERTGIIGDRGARTVTQMVKGAVDHFAHHLPFLDEKRIALGIER